MTVKLRVLGGAQSGTPYGVDQSGPAVTAIDALTPASDTFPYYTGAGSAALTAITAAARSFLAGVSTTVQRAALGLGSLATLNSVNNGNWPGTALSIANGGTGATTPAGARTALGITNATTGAIATKTAAYTLLPTDYTILADATSAAFAATLPAASGNSGLIFNIKKIDSTSNQVTLTAAGSDLIDGVATKAIVLQWTNICVQCNGSGWFIV